MSTDKIFNIIGTMPGTGALQQLVLISIDASIPLTGFMKAKIKKDCNLLALSERLKAVQEENLKLTQGILAHILGEVPMPVQGYKTITHFLHGLKTFRAKYDAQQAMIASQREEIKELQELLNQTEAVMHDLAGRV